MSDSLAEFRLMISDPATLANQYLDQVANGTPLDPEQVVKFAYLRTLFPISNPG